jgi:hypothetical protein
VCFVIAVEKTACPGNPNPSPGTPVPGPPGQQRERKLAEHTSHHPPSAGPVIL